MGAADKDAIKQVIETAYIKGIHGTQDETTVKNGFHRAFSMLVLNDGAVEKVMVDEWLKRIDVMKRENPDMWAADTHHEFQLVDNADYAAVAKLDVYKGEIHFSTDYMLLYKINGEWKIVSKIFAIPG